MPFFQRVPECSRKTMNGGKQFWTVSSAACIVGDSRLDGERFSVLASVASIKHSYKCVPQNPKANR